MTTCVRVQPLDAESYAPFGTILAVPERSPDIAGQHNRYWDHAVPFRVRGAPQVGFLEVYWRPLVVTTLERHLLHTQAFIPLEGKPLIQAVAPPSTRCTPDPREVRAFLLDGSAGVLLHEGTWHHLFFPLVPKAHVVLLLQEGTKEHDMEIVPLPEPIEIRI